MTLMQTELRAVPEFDAVRHHAEATPARRARDIAAFETALRENDVRLYITNSALHNPTGATLSPAKAHALLKLAERYKLVLVEDDIFAGVELVVEGPVDVAAEASDAIAR